MHTIVHFYFMILCLVSLIETRIIGHYPESFSLWIVGVIIAIISMEFSLHEPVFRIYRHIVPAIYILIVPFGLVASGSIVTPSILYAFFALISSVILSNGLMRWINGSIVIFIVGIFAILEMNMSPQPATYIVNYGSVYIDWILFYTSISLITVRLLVATSTLLMKFEEQLIKQNIFLYDKSSIDSMTKTFNRQTGIEKLEGLLSADERRHYIGSLCYIDINGLKEVNDTLGHNFGDELIVSVAEAIKETIREQDFVVRLGGDEFLIVFNGIDSEMSETIWKRVIQACEKINQEDGRPYIISLSHGIVAFDNKRNTHVDDLIQAADTKMYDEKKKKKEGLIVIRKKI